MKVDPKYVNIWDKFISKVNSYKSSLIDGCTKCFIELCMCLYLTMSLCLQAQMFVYQTVTEHLSVCSPAYWRLEVSRRVLVYYCVFFSVCACAGLCASARRPWSRLYVIKGLLSSDNSALPLLLNMLRVEIWLYSRQIQFLFSAVWL